ncbi:response regulator [Indioceanicola profundi]|uniref:response regulator n=1 Tax=Indioceanicola profundi TaxID=2220096 RepID=UPI000E6AD4EB|nr:response regulator [Indioceanicola profundi]
MAQLESDIVHPSLGRAEVLVVEDEPFIAMDLVYAVEDANGMPVGPAATVRQALAMVKAQDIKAAILDVNLPDGDVGPVLEALIERSAAVVVHTGTALPPEVRVRFPQVPIYAKPTPAVVLTSRLASELKR